MRGANIRPYLTQKFNIGRDIGRKKDPEQVAKDMRTVCIIDGERMCLKQRSKIQQESDDATDTDASASDIDVECSREVGTQ